MRVVVADDSLLTREGIVHLLESGGFDVVGQAADAAGALDLVAEHAPDVVVIDIRMPPTNTDEGLVATETIRDRYSEVSVLVLSQYFDPAYAVRLLESRPQGVGYLLKERVFTATVLHDAVTRVGGGECYVDSTIVASLVGRPRRENPVKSLSARELEVLSLVAEGRSNRSIAAELFVTERTVEAHVTNIFLKLRIDARPDSHRRVLAVLAFLRA